MLLYGRGGVCAPHLTPDGGTTVHVLRCVFQQAVTSIVVLDVVEGDGLKAPPAQRQNERVAGFQDTIVPAMFLQAHLLKDQNCLSWFAF